MAVVEVPVGRGKYNVSCRDGEEGTIKAIAKKLNERTNRMALAIGRADNEILLLMTALTLESELEDLKEKLISSVSEPNRIEAQEIKTESVYSQEDVEKYINETEKLLTEIVKNIEGLANKVDSDKI